RGTGGGEQRENLQNQHADPAATGGGYGSRCHVARAYSAPRGSTVERTPASGEEEEQHVGGGGAQHDRVHSVEESAVPRQPGADVLDAEVTFDERLGEVPDRRRGHDDPA